jgi:predicted NAD-dependent protein-ADP-ribosyltransferase YbiA (DUF1768 family)
VDKPRLSRDRRTKTIWFCKSSDAIGRHIGFTAAYLDWALSAKGRRFQESEVEKILERRSVDRGYLERLLTLSLPSIGEKKRGSL